MEEAEVIFAQKLADCDVKVRRKALSRLRKYITSRVKTDRAFSEEDLIKVWKGLYYCMWMQDKPLIQEELANGISELIGCFVGDESQVVLFMKTFLTTMSREWEKIDRWRMDKFMMFIRRFLREYLEWLRGHNWDESLLRETLDVWQRTVISVDGESIPEGLKFHFASIYLDELDQVGSNSMSEDLFMEFLLPYFSVMGAKQTSDAFFDSIVKEIFTSILLQLSGELQNDAEEEETEQVEKLSIPYSRLESALFDVGKVKKLSPDRRKLVYDLVKKFRLGAAGQDPFEEVLSSGSDVSDSEIEQAAKVLIKQPQREEKLAYKRSKKRKSSKKAEDDIADPMLEAIENQPKQKKLKRAGKKSSFIQRSSVVAVRSSKRAAT